MLSVFSTAAFGCVRLAFVRMCAGLRACVRLGGVTGIRTCWHACRCPGVRACVRRCMDVFCVAVVLRFVSCV